jgi:putative ABC transport system ATP-binding protein
MSLVVENVTLELGDGEQKVRALDNVSATIAAGTFTAVLGPSGAGKSSLLAVCGGLCSPTQGSVSIDGQKISSLDAGALTKIRLKKIGFVFQQSNLVPALTAVDQLLLLVHMQGRKPNHLDRDRALSLLEEVDMVHRAQHRSNQLSGGECQRVGIARALMCEPKVMLVDEPTSMLDHGRGHTIVELLATRCHQHGVATLMVTHDRAMLDVVDQIMNIQDGQLTLEAA